MGSQDGGVFGDMFNFIERQACHEYIGLQNRWYLMAVVSQDWLHHCFNTSASILKPCHLADASKSLACHVYRLHTQMPCNRQKCYKINASLRNINCDNN